MVISLTIFAAGFLVLGFALGCWYGYKSKN